MSAHPPPVALERFSVRDLPREASAEIAAHVESCPRCQAFLKEVAQDSKSLQAMPPDRILQAVGAARQRHLRIARCTQVGLASALAAMLLVLAIPRAQGLRLKGVGLAVHRKRGDVVQMIDSTATLRAGDALRLVVTLPKSTSLAVWSLDAHGRIDRLSSPGGMAANAGETALPGSAVVESPCVDLWLVLMTGAKADEQLAAALRKAQGERIPAGDQWAPAGALVKSFRCEN